MATNDIKYTLNAQLMDNPITVIVTLSNGRSSPTLPVV